MKNHSWGAGQSRNAYLVVAETFAPVAECVLFLAFGNGVAGQRWMWRDFMTILVANLASFAAGELLNAWSGLDLS